MNTKKLRQQYVEAIYQTRSLLIREEPIDLKSGRKSHVYLNHNNFLVQSRYLNVVADLYIGEIDTLRANYQIGVVSSIMSPIIAGAISARRIADLVVLNSLRGAHGVKDETFGNLAKEVVLIDDMTSSGATIIEAASVIREQGGVVSLAVVSASRDNTAKDNLAKHGIDLVSLLTFDQIFDLLAPRLSKEELKLIQIERELRSTF